MMRIDASSSFTGQWLFDAVILTLTGVNGKGMNHHELEQKDYEDIIDRLIFDAKKLEDAVGSLSSQFREPSELPIKVFMAVPYFHPYNKLNISGEIHDLYIPERRLSATRWYLNLLITQVRSKSWRFFDFGVFYDLGSAEDYDDAEYLVGYNAFVHRLNLESIWVPLYDNTNSYAFKGYQLGFDTVIIRPGYSFRSPIDGGILQGDRLYNIAQGAAGQGQCMGYEVRSYGEAEVEYFMAHQYLAVLAQFIGCEKQAFFSGERSDIFDKVTSKATAPGKMWDTYEDLTNHLDGQWIRNMETNLATNFKLVSNNRKEISFRVVRNHLDNLNAIRLDFRDFNSSVPWRGKLSILLDNNELRSSYAYRIGTDNIIPEFNSVFVPISNEKINSDTTSTVVIRLEKEDGSPWPYIERMMATKNEALFVANPAAFSISRSYADSTRWYFQDSVKTHRNYASGKLTDGNITKSWRDGNAVGWSKLDSRITITIDLGSVKTVSKGRVYTWKELPYINFPRNMAALAAVDCEPQERGTLAGCMPSASTGYVSIIAHRQSCSKHCDSGHYTAAFESRVNARYVTLSFVATAWALLDEVEVLDENNQVISKGMPYRVSPKPGAVWSNYWNDAQKLVDGVIFKDYIPYGNMVPISRNIRHYIETVFVKPLQNLSWAIIWMTNESDNAIHFVGGKIRLPRSIEMQWRNHDEVWQNNVTVNVKHIGSGVCTASPCAALSSPRGARVTGVRGWFSPPREWIMVSEISFM